MVSNWLPTSDLPVLAVHLLQNHLPDCIFAAPRSASRMSMYFLTWFSVSSRVWPQPAFLVISCSAPVYLCWKLVGILLELWSLKFPSFALFFIFFPDFSSCSDPLFQLPTCVRVQGQICLFLPPPLPQHSRKSLSLGKEESCQYQKWRVRLIPCAWDSRSALELIRYLNECLSVIAATVYWTSAVC